MNKKKPRRRSNLLYYIKEGVSSIFRYGFMSFASVVIIVACLLIMGSFLLVALNVNDLIEEAESRNHVVAFIDYSLSEEDARGLEGRILATQNVEGATFVSRRQIYEEWLERHGEEYVAGIDEEVFRHRFIIDLEDIAYMRETLPHLRHIPGVALVDAPIEMAEWFVLLRNVAAGVFVSIVGVLLVISIFIISNTIKLATFDRREEIAIMRMVGATNWFIRWPFIFQGFILGLTGAALAFGIQWGIYGILADLIMRVSGGHLIQVVSFASIADMMIMLFLGTGFVVGTIGSVIAIRNYLKV
ncbi:MAG: ABC transporter permease [Oscillospiraceae bacterium]|nr:ABC transporter permease [Oscillospiraceae bacterium]